MKPLLFIFLLSLNAISAEDIDCSNLNCSISAGVTIDDQVEFVNYSIMELTNPSDELNISNPVGTTPRDVRMYLQNSDISGSDITINFNSTKSQKDAGNLILVTNYVDTLNVSSNGYSGASYEPSSYICAQKMINGDFGTSALVSFNARRVADILLPLDRCVTDDLTDIQSNAHTCEPGYTVSTGNINANRWIGKRLCDGDVSRKLCVRKKKHVKCHWPASKISQCCNIEASPPGSGWICNVGNCNGTDSGWYKDYFYTQWEDLLAADIVSYGSESNLCDNIFPRTADNIETTTVVKDWKGTFSGSWRVENLDLTYSISSRKVYNIEFAVGGTVHSDGNNPAYLDDVVYLSNFNSWTILNGTYTWQPFILGGDGNHDYMNGFHSSLGCYLNGGFSGNISCALSTLTDTSAPTTNMRKESSYSVRVRIYYINNHGQKAIDHREFRIGHF